MASMDVDIDERSTPEQREARDKEDRARELQEQAGMRIIFCDLFISSWLQLFPIRGHKN